MTITLNTEQTNVLAEVVEYAIDQLDMDNMTALALLKEVQAMLPTATDRVIQWDYEEIVVTNVVNDTFLSMTY